MKLCFLLLNSYPILANTQTIEYAGGTEVEYVSLAKELVNLRYNVSFVTYKEKGCEIPEVENINGIEVIKTYPKYQAENLNAFLKTKFIVKALKRAHADVYFGCGPSCILSIFSLLYNRKFLYRISSDIIASGGTYYSSQTRLLRYYFESLANRIEVRRAVIVVAQTERQKKLLKEKIKANSIVIRNGFPVCKPFNFKREKASSPVVLWVGSISKIKQPQVFLELAKRVPEATFEMIGFKAKKEPQLYDFVRQESEKVPNFKFRGFIPFSEIDSNFKRASLLVNTSIYEGFPMSFIQAWLNYTPTVSLNIDPDGIIKRENMGFCSKSFDKLIRDVCTLITNESLREEMGQTARKYSKHEFDIKIVAKKYDDLFKRMLEI